MQIERIRPTALQVTLHPFELATLVAAARWIVEGAEGELPEEAIQQLRRVVAAYDNASRQLEQQGTTSS